ncbi:MAG TPA: hypothetical protein VJN43_03210 [Bryobacteraceae bacterium]|nr:hypothetical protein [Bryobacteraceae bacterium]
MAATAPGMGAGSLRVNLFDGTRQPVPANLPIFLRVFDGNQNSVFSNFVDGPNIALPGVPFFDNLGDLYRIVAHAKGYRDTGIYPVRIVSKKLVDADLMLLPENGGFHFDRPASIEGSHPQVFKLLGNGLTDAQFQQNFSDAMERQPQPLGAVLNIATAMESIPLASGKSPLDFYWQLEWDLLAPDRFWAWVDASLVEAVRQAAALHTFAEEANPEHFHPGIPGRVDPATASWKEIRFDVANVQLTFHEANRKTIPVRDAAGAIRNVDCVMAEPDIDYFKDLGAHGLLEVLPNALTGGKTDPQMVYMLRWMATRQEGLPDFNPPFTIEA